MNIVILAAGASSRMGQHKLLLEIHGQTLLQRAVQTALTVSPNVLVVLGRDAEKVQASLQNQPVQFVTNPLYMQGMETSFATAVKVLEARASIFMLADMPFVDVGMLLALQTTFFGNSLLGETQIIPSHRTNTRFAATDELPLIVASRYGSVIAPPHLFSSGLLPLLGEIGAKPTIQKNLERTVFLEWQEEKLFDVDTPEDLARLEQDLEF